MTDTDIRADTGVNTGVNTGILAAPTVAALPESGAIALPVLPISGAERDRAVTFGLRHTSEFDLRYPVITWVERHAAETPDSVAVHDAVGELSYRNLVLRARCLARALDDAGAAGRVVAVGGPRGADTIAAFLAIELVGAIYLPLEQSWPRTRLADVLVRSGAVAVLAAGEHSRPHPATVLAAEAAGCPVLAMGPVHTDPWHGEPRLHSDKQIRYVLYTSGSTGAPKGAVVEHQGMLNHLWCKVSDLALTGNDRLAQTAPLGFDISVWQMLAPLLVGGLVEVVPDAIAQDPGQLVELVRRREITVLEVVPTLLRLLTEELRDTAEPVPTLRWMLATGEELLPEVAGGWLATAPKARLLNAYGPTECSDDVTHHVVTPPDLSRRRLPIGTPVGNTSLYVLAEDHPGSSTTDSGTTDSGTTDSGGDGTGWRACEPGTQGELFVGGVSVGRGYLGDQARTRAAFFQDPFTTTSTGRLYRTGDVVRLTQDGTLEYLGRADRQVKLGGVRMELSEIEAVLRTHPSVAECAVQVWKPEAEDGLIARETAFTAPERLPRLVAYVCAQPTADSSGDPNGDPSGADPTGFDPNALRQHCADRLPPAMVASSFVLLPALPLTRNGKIDYAALPEPAATPALKRPEYQPPLGAVEAAVAGAIEAVLGVQRVSRTESFVQLGGDSLRAMRLSVLLRRRGVRVDIRAVLAGRTPEGIAALAVVEAPATTPSAQRPSVTTDAPSRPKSPKQHWHRHRHPLTPYQDILYRSWALARENPAFSYQGTLRLSGPLDTDRLADAWAALLEENPVLRAWFACGPGPLDEPFHEFPVWDIPLPPVTDLTGLTETERVHAYRAARLRAATEPFDLTALPALRVELFAMNGAPGDPAGARVHHLLITMHEIVLDGWGVTVFLERLAQLYGQESEQVVADPVRARDYPDYLAWQVTALSRRDDDPSARYWRDQLAGKLPVTTLPKPPPFEPATHRAEVVERLLDHEELRRVRQLCGEVGSTPFMVLLAGYVLALRAQSPTDEVIVGAPIANRDQPEQSEVLAFLLNVLPLRVRIEPADTGRKLLLRVREVVLNGYASADLPLAAMLRAAGKEPTEQPFQAVLNLLTYPARQIRAGGVDFSYTVHDPGHAKFDYAIYGQEHGTGGMVLQLAYRVDALTDDAAAKLMDTMVDSVRLLVADPDTLLNPSA